MTDQTAPETPEDRACGPTAPNPAPVRAYCAACNQFKATDVLILDHGDHVEATWPYGHGAVLFSPEIVDRLVELENERRDRERSRTGSEPTTPGTTP